METDDDLRQRYTIVKDLHQAAVKQLEKSPYGKDRSRRLRWCGSLYFTLCTIVDELERRGLQ